MSEEKLRALVALIAYLIEIQRVPSSQISGQSAGMGTITVSGEYDRDNLSSVQVDGKSLEGEVRSRFRVTYNSVYLEVDTSGQRVSQIKDNYGHTYSSFKVGDSSVDFTDEKGNTHLAKIY